MKSFTVTKETLVGEVINADIEAARFFFEIGMGCVGCPHSQNESIDEACMVHGADADALIEKLNAYFAGKQG